jgi:hypothetical protein
MVKEMNLNSYKEFMDDIFEMSKDFVVVEGAIDIELNENNIGQTLFKTYNTKDIPWFWVVMGKPHEEMIEDCLKNSTWDVDGEGHYRFKAIFKYEPPEYGDYGRMIMGDYYDISHIDLEFEETFIQRKRNEILNQMEIDDDFFNFK